MKRSVILSLLFHLAVFYALLTMFEVVPEVNLPDRIYSVQIFSPRRQEKKPPEQKTEVKKPEEPVKEEVPEKEPEKEPEVKPEEKPKEPEPEPKDDSSMDVSVKEEPEEGTSIAVDAPRFPFSYYLGAIQRKVSGNWFAKSGKHGSTVSCVVYFRLGRDGRISGLRVEQRSGDPFFDRAALRAIRSSEPFPPLPRAYTEPSLGIHFKFVQRL